MKHDEFVKAVSDRTGLSAAVADGVVRATFAVIKDRLATVGVVKMLGLGQLVTRVKPAHKGKNPRTGALVDVPETIKVKFRVSKSLGL